MALPNASSAAPGFQPGLSPSAFDARGIQAAQILDLTWILLIGAAVILVVVLALAWLALRGPDRVRASLARHGWIVGGGIAFPIVVLSALLVYSFGPSRFAAAGQPAAARIEVTGELWWWRVRYLDAAGRVLVEAANEVHLPAGVPVELLLKSDNVVHSFWVPQLAGKLDMIPNHVNRLRIQADAPGIFRGACAEFCGAQHAKMAFHVVAHPPQEFQAWLAAQQQPAAAPTGEAAVRGLALFARARCVECHTVRGASETGGLAPDLTHFGSRLSIAAGTLPNTPGAVADWIVRSQHVKPGARMPAFGQFSSTELAALAAYLEGLR